MSRELTDWRGRFDWLAAVPVTPQQQVLRDLDKSIRAFYDKDNPARRPRFKRKKSHATASWNLTAGSPSSPAGCRWRWPAGGPICGCVWSRPLPSAPRSVTVYRDAAGRWWASFVVRVEPEPVGATGQSTGVDVGLSTFATTEYADADVPNPRFARAAAKALARSQRNLARKQKGSKNRVKAKTARAKVEAHTANQRRDFQHKQARTLARRFDRIGVEDLRITNMVRNRHLARSISDAGVGRLLAGSGLAGPQGRPRGSPPRPAQHNTDLLRLRCESQAPSRVGRPNLRCVRNAAWSKTGTGTPRGT